MNNNEFNFPGGIIILGPGGCFGEIRKSIVEIKGAFTSLVIPLEPGSGRFIDGKWSSLEDFDHITIHPNLQTHLQRNDDQNPLELSAAMKTNQLIKPICLVSISAAPEKLSIPTIKRHQKKFEGGGAIIGVTADQEYNPSSTHLFIDIWAIPKKYQQEEYRPKWPNARTLGHRQDRTNIFGPIPAPWAFRKGTIPPDFIFGTP